MNLVNRVILQNMDGSREVGNFLLDASLIQTAGIIVMDNCYFQYMGGFRRAIEGGYSSVYRQVPAPLWLNSDGTLKKSIPGTLDPEPEIKGTVELKADLQLDARDLQEVLALLQFNEISLLRAMTIIQDWTLGHKPLSSDLPVKSEDNPLISSDQCAMDVLREIREDIIKRREQNAIDAAFLASFVDRYHISLNIELANEMRAIIERLTADAHGKPVPQELKGPWSFKVGDPRLPKFSVIQEGTTEEFVFRANSDGSLTPEMKGAGARVEHMSGIGKVVVMPLKPMFDGPVLGKEMKWVPVDALRELEAAMELAMRQFSDSVKGALQKFHETP